MPTEDTLGRLLVRDALPPDLRHLNGPLDKRGIAALYGALAEAHPDKYREVSKRLADLAGRAAYASGGYSFGPEHLAADPGTRQLLARFHQEVQQVLADPALSPKMRDAKLVQLGLSYTDPLTTQAMAAARAAGNPLALQVASGAKGKPENLKSLLAGDTLYADSNYEPVPIPVTRSFDQGLSPAQFFAGTFGARLAIVLTKLGTAEGGYFCLDAETRVRLPSGRTRAIGRLKAGDEVVGVSRCGVPAVTTVTAVCRAGPKYAYEYRFAVPGRRRRVAVTATPEHRLLVALPAPDPAAPCPTAVVPLELAFLPDARGAAGPDHVAHAVALLPCGHDGLLAPVALRPAVRAGVGEVDTVDVEVAHPDHLFLLANGLVVSNSKRIGNAAHRLVVTAPDRAHPPHPDEPARGLSTTVDDPDNEGALLAAPAGGHPRDTVLTREVIQDLKKKGVTAMLVRSPLVGGPADGGVYGHDVGVRERRTIAPVGDHVGRAAADSLSEPITQLIIGCLAAGTRVRMADGSTKPIEQLVVGDAVWGVDANPAGTPTCRPVRVTATFDNGVRSCHRYTCRVAQRRGSAAELELTCTPDHKVLGTVCGVNRQIPVADYLGDDNAFVLAFPAAPADIPVTGYVAGVTGAGELATYDIEVDHPDHLFLLANGLVVSNSKHSGGVAGATQGQQGFPVIDRLVSVPAAFPGAAAHAQADGTVAAVRDAPQGGKYVVVDGREHHVPVGQAVTVAPGDRVEAGDPLSDGVENPREVVTHKHVGEGRRRFVDAFMKVAQASGFRPFRRNVELVARGLIDHVELTAPHGAHVPGDVVSYTALENAWQPRRGHRAATPKEAVGQYLERPALHFSVGTRVKPSMLPAFAQHGVTSLTVHPDPPPFVPVMIRSHETINYDDDWMTRMLGTHLQDNLLEGVHRGDAADPSSTSYVPALAEGINFGAPGHKSTGWKPAGG